MKTKHSLIYYALIASLGAFVLGFDAIALSGAEMAIQQHWSLGSSSHGIIVSMSIWGCVVGAAVGGPVCRCLGYRRALGLSAGLCLFSITVGALATTPSVFGVARLLNGIGLGFTTVAAPLYIASLAPESLRGRLTGLFQLSLVSGILVAFISNFGVSHVVEFDAWRWMLGLASIPAFAFLCLNHRLPPSPLDDGLRKDEAPSSRLSSSFAESSNPDDTLTGC